ncbi:MAG: dihydroorotate dehydrogenase-like protein [Anaerolineales bacterium]|jgi:dihydroorotate dehydrogenase (fumarate)
MKTNYMGIEIGNPLIIAACSISSMIDRIELAEKTGAGALVIRSLFEEQIQFDALRFEEALSVGSDSFPESLSYLPEIQHAGASEHLRWIEKSREAVKMPLFASLNAATPGAWSEYARQLEGTGVDGLELNVYAVPTDPKMNSQQIEDQLYEIVEAVISEVEIPVAVKLSPFYSSMPNVAAELSKRKVSALVLFNRFLQPDIDPKRETLLSKMPMSDPGEIKLPLRWIALLYGRVACDLILNTGVHSGLDIAKAILAGATAVQSASALLENGIPHLSTMLQELEAWMVEHGYDRMDDFRGTLSQKEIKDPFAFERAHYISLLTSQK